VQALISSSSPSVLRALGVAAYAYAGAGPDDPRKRELRGDYLASLARHQRIKHELVPLVAAWHDAGIETLLYKGFYLDEWVYPVAGTRHHGDLDALLRPKLAPRALEIALRLGWVEGANAEAAGRTGAHAAFTIYRRSGDTMVDAHRWIIDQGCPGRAGPSRLTDAVWAASERRPWEGTWVRVPHPADAFLMGLVLDRCVAQGWSGFKPFDSIDLAALRSRGLSEEVLRARARELGVSRTLALALSYYDPTARTFRKPRPWLVPWLRLVSLWETGFLYVPPRLRRLPRGPRVLWEMLRVLPVVTAVRRALATQGNMVALLAMITPNATTRRPSSRRRRWRTVSAIRWAHRLLPLGPRAGDCLPRALATYVALRRQGWQVAFVTGVRREGNRTIGHAWVEDEHGPLPELQEPGPTPRFVPAFRYPA